MKEKDIHSGKVSDASDDDDDDSHFIDPSPPPKKKAAPAKKPYVAPVLDSDSEDENPMAMAMDMLQMETRRILGVIQMKILHQKRSPLQRNLQRS